VVQSMASSAGEQAPAAAPFRPAAYGETDVGRVRERNEDTFAVLAHQGLFMVADGMGGAAGGALASRMVIERVQRAMEDAETTWPVGASAHGVESGPRRFLAGILRANREIHRLARQDIRKKGMGTTFAGLLLLARCAVVAHVGDSRVYRLREGRLERMTHDHSLVNHLMAMGCLRPEEAASHPKRNVITRAVGPCETVDVDTKIVDTRTGDAFLLCSDGLHGALDDAEIAAILREHGDLADAVGHLIDRANECGGKDNVTAVLMRLEPVSGAAIP